MHVVGELAILSSILLGGIPRQAESANVESSLLLEVALKPATLRGKRWFLKHFLKAITRYDG